jgi:uncharacterized coiled-coil DUF342 family protein
LPDDERVNRRELLALCDAADELREAREKIAELRSCRTCGGEPGAQNCVCGGTNNVDREITGLRLVLLERDKEVTSLSAEVERLKGEVEKYTDEAPRLVDTIAALSRKYDAANDLASSLSARLASLREQGIAEVDEFDPLGPSLRICGVYVRSSYHQTRREQLVDLHEAADAVNSAFRVRLEGRG